MKFLKIVIGSHEIHEKHNYASIPCSLNFRVEERLGSTEEVPLSCGREYREERLLSLILEERPLVPRL